MYEINSNKDIVNCLQDVAGILLELSLPTTNIIVLLVIVVSSGGFIAMDFYQK